MASRSGTSRLIIWAALLLAAGVAAGAFGAHGLRNHVSPQLLDTWQTAVLYQLVHGLGMLLVISLYGMLNAVWLKRACYTMLAGTLVFSGSLYCLVLTGERLLGAVTPFGGILFIVAWLMVAVAAGSQRDPKGTSR